MYATRRFSQYILDPNSLSLPPEGPNSGFLLIHDVKPNVFSFFSLCKNPNLKDLPFPQNKDLTICYKYDSDEYDQVYLNDAIFIPVLNLPLSSNRYYVIMPNGDHEGEAITCSNEDDMSTCCFCRCVKDVEPKPFDSRNIYQQFEISVYQRTWGNFYAKSVAPDGFPPLFLQRKGWKVRAKTPRNYELDDAPGLNADLRTQLPDSNFPLSCKRSEAVVVGEWYSPFMFIKDGTLKDQMKRSIFYRVTLEQNWEQIYSCLNNNYNEKKSVNFDVILDTETVYIAGNKGVLNEINAVEGTVWFRSSGRAEEEGTTVGLSVELVQRMKWEQARAGWIGEEKQVKVERMETFEKNGVWREFGCYVLVESFALKRMDGSLVMTYSFAHPHHIKCRWEYVCFVD